jgi:transposase InsO family protein
MGLSRSTYYYRPRGPSAHKQKQDADLRDRIEQIALKFPRYGYRRVTAQLKREGFSANHKRVLRLMRESDLCCKRKRKWVCTTDSAHGFRVYPNLYRDAKPAGINQVWVADITYIRLLLEFVYLAVILDAFSRRVVGYALSRSLDASLTLGALAAAISDRNPALGCIHHSDRGVQYACDDYVRLLGEAGFRISMSRRGNPFDNAQAESFFKTLKHEEVNLTQYRNFEEVKACIPTFIEQVYNRERLHSALGYRSPVEFEEQYKTSPSECTYLAAPTVQSQGFTPLRCYLLGRLGIKDGFPQANTNASVCGPRTLAPIRVVPC